MKTKPPTSMDVARLATVSQATVSVVLNGTSGNIRVSEATRQRVIDAATKLNYSPNPAARALRTKRNSIIAYIPRSHRGLPGVQPGPYHFNAHISRFAMQHGYHSIEMSSEDDSTPDELLRSLLDRRVDGVIYHKPDSPEKVQRLVDYGLPVVQLMRPQFDIETSNVTVDVRRGIEDGVDHLIELGHRDIAFLDHDDALATTTSRAEIFRSALEHRGYSVPDDFLRQLVGNTLDQAHQHTLALLERSPRPTALFAASGAITLGVMRALYEAEVRVPDHCSVLSFDDIFAPYLYPPVTCVNPTLELAAERAVDLLVEQIEAGKAWSGHPQQIVLPTELVVRSSTSSPPTLR